jgi:hypothetical protein
LTAISLTSVGCASSAYQVDKTFAAFSYGVLTEQIRGSLRDCERAKTDLERALCDRVRSAEKTVDSIASRALAADEAQEAFKNKLLQLGMKAATGL